MLSYCDDLNKELRALGVGCYIAGTFKVVTCYHNDMLLLSPTLSDMAALMVVCERYARTITKILPIKSKTKCLYMCGDKNQRDYPECLHLNGRKLPFVSSATNLGHTLSQDCTMDLYRQVCNDTRDILFYRADPNDTGIRKVLRRSLRGYALIL